MVLANPVSPAFWKSEQRIWEFYCDEAEFYDNDNGFVKVAEYCNGELRTIGNQIPNWLAELQDHLKPWLTFDQQKSGKTE